MSKRLDIDGIFYLIGKIIFLPGILAGIWFANYGYAHSGELFSCYFRSHFGVICPGCGATRALVYFFQGRFWKSFIQHPGVITGILCYLHFLLGAFCRKHNIVTVIRPLKIENYVYLLAFVIILQWIIKLIFLFTR